MGATKVQQQRIIEGGLLEMTNFGENGEEIITTTKAHVANVFTGTAVFQHEGRTFESAIFGQAPDRAVINPTARTRFLLPGEQAPQVEQSLTPTTVVPVQFIQA